MSTKETDALQRQALEEQLDPTKTIARLRANAEVKVDPRKRVLYRTPTRWSSETFVAWGYMLPGFGGALRDGEFVAAVATLAPRMHEPDWRITAAFEDAVLFSAPLLARIEALVISPARQRELETAYRGGTALREVLNAELRKVHAVVGHHALGRALSGKILGEVRRDLVPLKILAKGEPLPTVEEISTMKEIDIPAPGAL